MQVFANALQGETEEQIDASIEDGAYKSNQAILFEQQLDLAVELGLNVVIHQRDAWEDTLEIMQPYTDKLRGVFHCFGGSLEQADEVIDLDHLVSFTGIVTFKNGASVRQVAAQIPLWKFMVETDCPYLAPVPVSRETLRACIYPSGGRIDRRGTRDSAGGIGGSHDRNRGKVFSVQSMMNATRNTEGAALKMPVRLRPPKRLGHDALSLQFSLSALSLFLLPAPPRKICSITSSSA